MLLFLARALLVIVGLGVVLTSMALTLIFWPIALIVAAIGLLIIAGAVWA